MHNATHCRVVLSGRYMVNQSVMEVGIELLGQLKMLAVGEVGNLLELLHPFPQSLYPHNPPSYCLFLQRDHYSRYILLSRSILAIKLGQLGSGDGEWVSGCC